MDHHQLEMVRAGRAALSAFRPAWVVEVSLRKSVESAVRDVQCWGFKSKSLNALYTTSTSTPTRCF